MTDFPRKVGYVVDFFSGKSRLEKMSLWSETTHWTLTAATTPELRDPRAQEGWCQLTSSPHNLFIETRHVVNVRRNLRDDHGSIIDQADLLPAICQPGSGVLPNRGTTESIGHRKLWRLLEKSRVGFFFLYGPVQKIPLPLGPGPYQIDPRLQLYFNLLEGGDATLQMIDLAVTHE